MLDPYSDVMELVRRLSREVVGVIARRVGSLDGLTPDEAGRLVNASMFLDQREMQSLLDGVSGELSDVIGQSTDSAEADAYESANAYYEATARTRVAQSIIDGLTSQARGSMLTDAMSFVKTSAFPTGPISEVYRQTVSEGVAAVAAGVDDYRSAVRKSVAQLGRGSLVIFESGRKVRLDSVVAMHISDSTRNLYDNINAEHGKAFGADGFEVSTHALCAPDHLPIQGRQFLFDDSEIVGLARPIGDMNCRHTKTPVIVGINRTHSAKELAAINARSNEVVNWNGVSGKPMQATRYEASQYQREVEASIRRTEDEASALTDMGDTWGAGVANTRAKALKSEYRSLSKQMGLRPQAWRYAN